jgi:hypothetical protein
VATVLKPVSGDKYEIVGESMWNGCLICHKPAAILRERATGRTFSSAICTSEACNIQMYR